MWSLRRWMSRLAFSFLIVGVVLAWQAWQTHQQDPGSHLVWLYGAGAVVGALLFAIGIRVRHPPSDEP